MSPTPPVTEFDVSLSFVRVLDVRANGFVAFEFAVGEPELYSEMMLHYPDFIAFCTTHRVQFLAAHTSDEAPLDDMDSHLKDVFQKLRSQA